MSPDWFVEDEEANEHEEEVPPKTYLPRKPRFVPVYTRWECRRLKDEGAVS